MKKNKSIIKKEKCIILNKAFEGAWNEIDGNISHEIINFFKADNGKYYVYNSPHGVVDNKIKNGKAEAKYLLITSSAKIDPNNSNNWLVDLLYCIKIKEYIDIDFTYINTRNKDKMLETNKAYLLDYITTNSITYGGVSIADIFCKSDLGYVQLTTFEGLELHKFNKKITKSIPNFKRGVCKYIYDKNTTYSDLIKEIESSVDIINGSNLTRIPLKTINLSKTSSASYNKKTFLDLILKQDNEECYTNMFYHIIQNNDIFIKFLNEFYTGTTKFSGTTFNVSRENSIVKGRMDICAISKDNEYRVVIENKIHSGLNGKNPEDNTTQLTQYYNWAKENNATPICFIMAPNYKISDLKNEIDNYDPNMKIKYSIIPYLQIKIFIEKYEADIIKNNSLINSRNIHDIIFAFGNHSYQTKEEKIRNDFLQEIEKHTKIKKKRKLIKTERQIKSHQSYKLGNIKN